MIDVFDKYYNSGVGIKLVLLKNTSFIEIDEIILHIVLTVFHYFGQCNSGFIRKGQALLLDQLAKPY